MGGGARIYQFPVRDDDLIEHFAGSTYVIAKANDGYRVYILGAGRCLLYTWRKLTARIAETSAQQYIMERNGSRR